MKNPDSPDVYNADFVTQVRSFIDQHREMLVSSLDGLTEEEARRKTVPSKTTLLGLIKHVTFVERVWFGEAATGKTRSELGIPETPDESFDLTHDDSIESVLTAYSNAVELSREVVEDLKDSDVLPGNRRGPLPLRWIYLHFLRELAQHCGHADIIREQVLASRQN